MNTEFNETVMWQIKRRQCCIVLLLLIILAIPAGIITAIVYGIMIGVKEMN